MPPITLRYFPSNKILFTGKHFHEIVTAISEKSLMSRDVLTFNFKDNIREKSSIVKVFKFLDEIFRFVFADVFATAWGWGSKIDLVYAKV